MIFINQFYKYAYVMIILYNIPVMYVYSKFNIYKKFHNLLVFKSFPVEVLVQFILLNGLLM